MSKLPPKGKGFLQDTMTFFLFPEIIVKKNKPTYIKACNINPNEETSFERNMPNYVLNEKNDGTYNQSDVLSSSKFSIPKCLQIV